MCMSSSRWILDCHDLLEDDGCDAVMSSLVERFSCASSTQSAVWCTAPRVLVVHTAPREKVEERFPAMRGRSLRKPVPPPLNKLNVMVKNVDNTEEFVAYVCSNIDASMAQRR